MNVIDFSPLYRNTVGFDRLASLLDETLRHSSSGNGYPPYNIERVDENRYAITLAVAGFERDELEIQCEQGVLSVRGAKKEEQASREFLYQGIATRTFERKFNLADFVEVRGAELKNGLLVVDLVKEIPEAMKPRRIEIAGGGASIEHQTDAESAA
ncbi:Hsp20 family protein [Motiliproteus sp. SC1-56]|uniref:Hsp20 family protein n=1 Tax=Motiliproteus sp. SC1-56 TaxID=2799565 RepID=UPI001A8C2CC0|nr:Hsp20 family protein [Motiliproteus sp. SC1-56]